MIRLWRKPAPVTAPPLEERLIQSTAALLRQYRENAR